MKSPLMVFERSQLPNLKPPRHDLVSQKIRIMQLNSRQDKPRHSSPELSTSFINLRGYFGESMARAMNFPLSGSSASTLQFYHNAWSNVDCGDLNAAQVLTPVPSDAEFLQDCALQHSSSSSSASSFSSLASESSSRSSHISPLTIFLAFVDSEELPIGGAAVFISANNSRQINDEDSLDQTLPRPYDTTASSITSGESSFPASPASSSHQSCTGGIYNVWVHPQHRGHSLGYHLSRTCLLWALHQPHWHSHQPLSQQHARASESRQHSRGGRHAHSIAAASAPASHLTCARVLLESSRAGRPVYQRLGFKHVPGTACTAIIA
jgi:GNAT superfamily N-acetyltransferase